LSTSPDRVIKGLQIYVKEVNFPPFTAGAASYTIDKEAEGVIFRSFIGYYARE
jgi:hypothetical protein